jgi:hypothetical protein
MRLNSRSAPRPPVTATTKLLVVFLALLAVIAGLLSMHALDATISHSGQPTAAIADVLLDSTDHVDSIATPASSDEIALAGGLLGCAAAGMLCALGVIALMRRATGTRPPSGVTATASREVAPQAATRSIHRAAPSIFALTVLRT